MYTVFRTCWVRLIADANSLDSMLCHYTCRAVRKPSRHCLDSSTTWQDILTPAPTSSSALFVDKSSKEWRGLRTTSKASIPTRTLRWWWGAICIHSCYFGISYHILWHYDNGLAFFPEREFTSLIFHSLSWTVSFQTVIDQFSFVLSMAID